MNTLHQFHNQSPRPRRLWERGPASPVILIIGMSLHVIAYVLAQLFPLPDRSTLTNVLLTLLDVAGMGLFFWSGLALATKLPPHASRVATMVATTLLLAGGPLVAQLALAVSRPTLANRVAASFAGTAIVALLSITPALLAKFRRYAATTPAVGAPPRRS